MTRIDIINHFIAKYNYKSYLEIGVQEGIAFRAINLPIENKVGVDPDLFSKATVHLSSDEFFKQNPTTKFDIIFIDGMHQATQVYRDINNALNSLSENGTIVCHDMIPASKEAQVLPRISKHWNGDCWMAWVWLRATNPNLEMRVLDRVDCGTAIIRRGRQQLIDITENIVYENLDKNKKEWLNTIHEEEFKDIY